MMVKISAPNLYQLDDYKGTKWIESIMKHDCRSYKLVQEMQVSEMLFDSVEFIRDQLEVAIVKQAHDFLFPKTMKMICCDLLDI